MTKLVLVALCAGFALGASARADEFRESVAARSGGTLEVELSAGSLEIETHDENRVDVEASSGGGGWSGGLEFTLSGDGTNAKLVARRRGWTLGWNGARARVRVPEAYSLELETGGGSIEIEAVHGSVRAQTRGGPIELEGAVGPVELSTSGGSISVEDVQGNTVLRSSGGGISARDVVGDVEARSSGGPIRIHDVDGRISARTSGGGISARFEGAPAGELRTSGGGIEVEFPEGLGAELDARTSGGRISVDAPLQVSGEIESGRVQGRLGPGGEKLELVTSGGNIRVREQ
ncbi:MAG: DUF4097 family beta strand repeat-containing protein [Myxococcota bacterium]